jgi:hypothetical protein
MDNTRHWLNVRQGSCQAMGAWWKLLLWSKRKKNNKVDKWEKGMFVLGR